MTFDDLPYDRQLSEMLSDNLGWTSTVAKQLESMGHSYANLNSSAIKFVSILSMLLGIYVMYLSAPRRPFISFTVVCTISIVGYFKDTDNRKKLLLIISSVVLSVLIAFTIGIVNSDSVFIDRVISFGTCI